MTLCVKTSIYQHSDYRSFLVAHFEDTQKRNPAWSYQAWALKLGLKNNTSLLKIIHGERNAGPEIQQKLVEYFRFGVQERAYFEDLIRLSKVKDDPALSVMVRERLQKRLPTGRFVLLDVKAFALISHWWFYAIPQLTRLPDFKRDPEWIASRLNFKVGTRELAQAVKTMEELDLLEPKGRGIQTQEDVSQEALKRFHEGALGIAQQAIRSVPVPERQISGLTLAVSSAKVPEMKDFIRRSEDEFIRLFSESTGGDAVYQFQTQLFPLTQQEKEK